MYLNCKQCNDRKIIFLKWLGGQDICNECKASFELRRKKGWCIGCGNSEKVFFSGRCEKCHDLFNNEKLVWQEKYKLEVEKDEVTYIASIKKSKKVIKILREIFVIVFGLFGLYLFVVMLIAQPDFKGIILGWVIIGLIYGILKITSR
jgi:hypothetical protein